MNPETLKRQALMDIKPIVFGEQFKEGIIKGTPVPSPSPCIFCDKEVWISDVGYNTNDPAKDIPIGNLIKKSCHKMCFFVLAENVFPAVLQNVVQRMTAAEKN